MKQGKLPEGDAQAQTPDPMDDPLSHMERIHALKPSQDDMVSLDVAPFRQDAGDRTMLSPGHAAFLIKWSAKLGLSPWYGHTCFYYGKPYINELGAITLARRNPLYRGYTVVRCMGVDPDEPSFESGGYGWKCTVYMAPPIGEVIDYGIVDVPEMKEAQQKHGAKAEFLAVVKRPGQVARARAIRRAHLRACPPEVDCGSIS